MSAALAIPASDRVVTLSDNAPPASPFDVVRNSTDEVFGEAKHWLDGKAVANQAEADAIAHLLDLARKTDKLAAETKDAEKRPHLDANKAIEDRFRPLTTRLKLVSDTCKAALVPWELAQERARQQATARAREEAAQAAQAAQEALRASSGNLQAREAAETLLRDAKGAQAAATKAEAVKSTTKVGGRAVALRTTYRAEVTDRTAFARFVWANHAVALDAFLGGLAQSLVDGKQRDLPGVVVHEERGAV